MPEFTEGLGFDLADALASDIILTANFLEGPGAAVGQPVTQFQDTAFAFTQAVEDFADPALEQVEAGDVTGILGGLVLYEIPEMGFIGVTDG